MSDESRNRKRRRAAEDEQEQRTGVPYSGNQLNLLIHSLRVCYDGKWGKIREWVRRLDLTSRLTPHRVRGARYAEASDGVPTIRVVLLRRESETNNGSSARRRRL